MSRLCPPGRFGDAPEETRSSCAGPCSAGHYCPAGSTLATQGPCATSAAHYCPEVGGLPSACALFADARHACRSVHFCIVLRDWLRLCVRVFCRARRPQWPCLWGTTRDLRVATAVPPTKPRRSCVVQAPTAVRACGLTVQVALTATLRCCHRLPARACVQRATSVTLGRPLPPKTHADPRRGECVRGQVERGRTSAQLAFVSVFKLLCVPGVRLSFSARFPPVVSAPQVLPCWLQRACGCQAWRVHPGADLAHTQQHRPMWQWHVLLERHRPTLSCGSVWVRRPSG